jgi:hypothetical protein
MRLDKVLAHELCAVVPSYSDYLRSDGSLIVKLQRALYGCVESGRLWYEMLRKVLETDGYKANSVEPCVFNKTVNNVQCTVVVYVDDLLITCVNKDLITDLLKHLSQAFNSELTVQEGPTVNYLGMKIDFSTPGTVDISMPAYIDSLLKISQTTGTASSPAGLNLYTLSENSPKLSQQQCDDFHSQVARLLYLAKRTRPDILLAVSFLTTRVQEPTAEDFNKLSRVLKYINGTRNLSLKLKCDPSKSIEAHIDAAYGVHADFKSHTGMTISLGYGVIDARSTKQKINTKSSTESELVALSDMCSKVEEEYAD